MDAYHLLFSTPVEHVYFSDHICKTLEFIPIGSAVATLNKAGLLVKSFESGISVFYDEDFMNRLRLHAEDGLLLIFEVFSKDPNFFRYTIPAAQTDTSIPFLSNQQVTVDVTDKRMLHSDH